ncbi:hypothetical protein A3I18_01230 [Candidatus Campbellbacteria bacterium RIFCSPLOWO2_02_FULL_35_11]|uniref:Uncharacterized protein n=2 Tax=Candidatus Campbelliibacteriota TaxID=1752727 RepID=A0A1F5EP76_9BACT|nr:MAG: hypothetical protein A3E89_01660 [Candidatus Campbellbacteria bacterium RIFCSPHIGHO2_12_FULL_35_10]OGD70845.1 MAG: hypothetical protein A3I18_01230 [Candidatus Campbellbacteria bacterium RIFCSPLOWO2_02_FULL_35_11]
MDHFASLVKTDEKAKLFRPLTTAKLSSSRALAKRSMGFITQSNKIKSAGRRFCLELAPNPYLPAGRPLGTQNPATKCRGAIFNEK